MQHPQAGAYLVTPASVAESDMKVHLDIMGGTIRRGLYCMPSTHVRTLAQLFGSFRNNRNMRRTPYDTVMVSGGFDPIHIGHVRMIQAAAELGEVIVVAHVHINQASIQDNAKD